MTKLLPTSMRPSLFVGLCIALFALLSTMVQAHVSAYTFSFNNLNTYNPIAGTQTAKASADTPTSGTLVTSLAGGIVYTLSSSQLPGFNSTLNGLSNYQVQVTTNGVVPTNGDTGLNRFGTEFRRALVANATGHRIKSEISVLTRSQNIAR